MLIRIEADRIKAYRLKKGPRQMVSVNGRLYRCDDHLMVRDINAPDAAVIYEIDGTQPMMPEPYILDPDMTRTLIASAKMSGGKKSIWMRLDASKAWQWLSVIAVVGSILYGILAMG